LELISLSCVDKGFFHTHAHGKETRFYGSILGKTVCKSIGSIDELFANA